MIVVIIYVMIAIQTKKNIIAQTVKTQVAYLVAHQLFFNNLIK
jgi:hypothetical protein